MSTRAIIVVGGGTSSRFGSEKLFVDVAGRPLLWHTVSAVIESAEKCVVVSRPDLVDRISDLALEVETVAGGTSRTLSEMAGLAALGDAFDLIGIHDAARPLINPKLINQLFLAADKTGGAVPVLEPDELLVDRRHLQPVDRPTAVQTPQVFRGPELLAAYVLAAQAGYEGHDTVDVVHRYGQLEIAAVPGDQSNIKVTYPEDLEFVRRSLEDPFHSEPR